VLFPVYICVIYIFSSFGNADFMHDFVINRVKLSVIRTTDKYGYLKYALHFFFEAQVTVYHEKFL